MEVIMDRPLRGTPYVDENMYCRQGLCSIACVDLMDRGSYLLVNIVETVDKRGQRDVKVPWGAKRRRVETEVPRFKP